MKKLPFHHGGMGSMSIARLAWIGLALLLLTGTGWPGFGQWVGVRPVQAHRDKSDLNHDGIVNLDDVILFSSKKLKMDWREVDWCRWRERGCKHKRRMDGLFAFIDEWFSCGQEAGDGLAVVHANDDPTRVCWGPGGSRLFVSDSKVGSVFLYDENVTVTAELKGLSRPLGVAVDSQGRIWVGNDGIDNIEVYTPDGRRDLVAAAGVVKTPNDMVVDRDDRVYVADSANDLVWVVHPDGSIAGSIGESGDGPGQLRFPVALAIRYAAGPGGVETGELYVADQGHGLVQVFDLEGNLLRSFGGKVKSSMMGGWKWQGKFVRIQSLALDPQGRLHAADSYMNKVQILDAETGAYIDSYGQYGSGAGELCLPLDIAIDEYGRVAVANTGNKRVDVLPVAP